MNDENNKRPLPEKFLLVKYGQNVYTKDGKVSTFDLTNEAADAIIREFTGRARDLVIDFEHATPPGGSTRSKRATTESSRTQLCRRARVSTRATPKRIMARVNAQSLMIKECLRTFCRSPLRWHTALAVSARESSATPQENHGA